MNRPFRQQFKPRAVFKNCFYCTNQTEPFYRDTEILSKFMTERGKIMPRSRTGTCSKHQRQVTKVIKQARQVALLPFVVRA
jgi:small subunit ribosomal protein S18